MPVSSLVFESAIVGVPTVFQQTPRSVTDTLPSAVTFPPLVAVVCVIADMAVVETVDF